MASYDESPYEAVNKYRNLKIIQILVIFILFGINLVVLFITYVSPMQDDNLDISNNHLQMNGPNFIILAILTGAFLIRGILCIVAVGLLHIGNEEGNKTNLKAFITIGWLTYSLFDICAGGFDVVRTRIVEIESKSTGQILC